MGTNRFQQRQSAAPLFRRIKQAEIKSNKRLMGLLTDTGELDRHSSTFSVLHEAQQGCGFQTVEMRNLPQVKGMPSAGPELLNLLGMFTNQGKNLLRDPERMYDGCSVLFHNPRSPSRRVRPTSPPDSDPLFFIELATKPVKRRPAPHET